MKSKKTKKKLFENHKNSFKLIKKNPKIFFKIFLFDLLFLISINVLAFLFRMLKLPENGLAIIISLLLVIAYFLVILRVYTFFKNIIMFYLGSFYKKTKIGFKIANKLYIFNILAILAFLASFFALNAIFLSSAKEETLKYVFLIITIPLMLVYYIFINISHSYFYQQKKISLKDISKKSIKSLLNVKTYISLFLFDILILTVYFGLYYLLGNLIKKFLIEVFSSGIIPIYKWSFIFITSIVFYLLISYNRIYFYNLIKTKTKK